MTRRSRRLDDDPETDLAHNVTWQSEVHDVEGVEKLSAKLDRSQFRIAAMTTWSVVDQCKVEIVKSRSAKRIASQGPKATSVGPGASGKIDRNVKERGVVRSLSTIILANGAIT